MREELLKRCELFVANRDAVKHAFHFDSTYMYPMAASLYALRGQAVDVEAMRRAKKLLNWRTGVFSNFRGNVRMAVVALLARSAEPEAAMENMLCAYKLLKTHFFASEYLAVTATAVSELAKPEDYEAIAKKCRSVYDAMKAAHPLITSGQDSAFAALLAMSGLDETRIAENAEQCFRILKHRFISRDAVQSLSHVLALDEAPADVKCARVTELYDGLLKCGYRYGRGYELPTLGVLALANAETELLIRDVMDADDYLKRQSGFGFWGVGSRQRTMYAAMMTSADYIPSELTMATAAVNGTVALVIAQQVAVAAAIAASAASSASASS